MPSPRSPIVVKLTDEQREELMKIVRSSTQPAGLVRRAKVIVMLADGKSFCEGERRTGLQRRHARKWAERFIAKGLAGLNDQKRPGRKPVFSPLGRTSRGDAGVQATGFCGAFVVQMGLPRDRSAIGA